MPPTVLSELLAVLEDKNQFPAKLDWLVPGRVVDVWFSGMLPTETQQFMYEFAERNSVDIFIQLANRRQFKLLISDMDSTMITVECIDELADYVGKKTEVSKITERAMNGELDFVEALTERVALLKGLSMSDLEACFNDRVTFMPGAKELVACMRRQGATCVLISGGFEFFTSRVAAALGFHAEHANQLELVDGVLTGRVLPPVLGKEAKLAALQKYVAELGIKPEEVMAVGDGANDLQMLLAAGFGVAYHAKPTVKRQAKHALEYTDLSSLIYAQGLTF